MKTAVVIMSDPKSGSEEALGRVFNGLAVASECKEKGDEVAVVFNGAGTRWPEESIAAWTSETSPKTIAATAIRRPAFRV